MAILELLKNKTQEERVVIKTYEFVKLGLIQRELHGKYEIEITELDQIEGGIEFYVRAWQDGVPVGLGVGSRFEKEHFVIQNPRILIDDPNPSATTIIKEWIDPDTGQLKRRLLKEDLRESLLRVVEHNILVTGKKGTAIKGTIGNTTSTFYPDEDPETNTVDGYVRRSVVSETWATIRGSTATEAFPSASIGHAATNK